MKYNKGTSRKNREKHASKKKRVSPIAQAIKMHVKKGDKVKVISGKDKGKTGEVLTALPKLNKVVVDGVAIAKRSIRKTGRGQSGRIVERPMPIHASNVALVEGTTKTKKKAKAAKA